jgi:hypothetical protein
MSAATTGGSGGFGGGFGGGTGTSFFRGGGGGGAGLGGAIFTMGADKSSAGVAPGSPDCTLIDCTLTGNAAYGGNGAREGAGGSGLGGALFNLDGSVTLVDDTLDANTVAAGAGVVTGAAGPVGDGSEVYNLAFGNNIPDGAPTSANLTLYNSILADGKGGKDLASQVAAAFGANSAAIGGSTNLVESVALDASTKLGASVITAAGSPQLGPLQNNGGLTPTMALATTSLAFGAGNAKAPLVPATDQRGWPRVVFGRLDLGAYENQTIALPPSVLNFVAQAVVTPNPHSLPPSAVVLFTPEATFISPGPVNMPFHIQGELTVSIQGGWSLDAVYTLDGQVSRTETPGAAGSNPLTAFYSYEAHVTETLHPPGPSNSPAWLYDTTESSHGEYSVDFLPISKTETAVDASFHDTTSIHQSIRKGGDAQPSWKFDGTVASQGILSGRDQATGQSTGKRKFSPMHIDRVIDATLAAVGPSGNPGPAWQVGLAVTSDASSVDDFRTRKRGQGVTHHGTVHFDTHVTETLHPPGPPSLPSPPPETFLYHLLEDEDFHSILIGL